MVIYQDSVNIPDLILFGPCSHLKAEFRGRGEERKGEKEEERKGGKEEERKGGKEEERKGDFLEGRCDCK